MKKLKLVCFLQEGAKLSAITHVKWLTTAMLISYIIRLHAEWKCPSRILLVLDCSVSAK